MYHRNLTYRKIGENTSGKSPEIFNAFLLLSFFSLLVFVLGFTIKGYVTIFGFSGKDPYLRLLLFYILLSNPVCLIEYIYLLNNRAHRIIQYGFYTFTAQLLFVIVPVILGKDLVWTFYGLLAVTAIRWSAYYPAAQVY
jgi:hypothetical protein